MNLYLCKRGFSSFSYRITGPYAQVLLKQALQ